jgi:2-methylisocitrate lyase-like PEP mutase family enzyme
MSLSTAEKRARFRTLHESGCFLLPNPWDAGSVRYLESQDFAALATTSAGAAFAMGRSDQQVDVDAMLAHVAAIVAASDLPVSADFEHGYASDEKGLAENVARCVRTGVAGLSIEDSTADPAAPLFDFEVAVQRVRVARAAIASAGPDTLLVARSECFLVGHPEPLPEVLRRLSAFAEAGADCVYAPGLARREDIEAVVKAVAPLPVNLLAGWPIGFTLEEIAAMGVRRVSVGGALALAAWGGFIRAVDSLRAGRFDGFAQNAPGRDLNRLFARR